MYYLNTKNLEDIRRNWIELTDAIRDAVHSLDAGEFAQPIKPYLRYRDRTNRIIAMPAFVGGEVNYAGIKWIASFPRNIDHGVKRAHSVSILNEADSGIPKCIINTTLISGIRTAAVTGLVIREFLKHRPDMDNIVVGMTGFGPIGQLHLEMVEALLGDRLQEFRIYDLRPIDRDLIPPTIAHKVRIAKSHEAAYEGTDMFITATVSKKPYISLPPKPGSLQLNVSLRDYVDEYVKYVDLVMVDDWEEICREKTDIEMMHLNQGLQEEDTVNLTDVFCRGAMEKIKPTDVVMFNPMGMAIFDIAVGAYYYQLAQESEIGMLLED